jgi:hypothetical protein
MPAEDCDYGAERGRVDAFGSGPVPFEDAELADEPIRSIVAGAWHQRAQGGPALEIDGERRGQTIPRRV